MPVLASSSQNADTADLLNMGEIVVVVVHVGKCAGETIISCLMRDGGSEFHLAELHCYDANERLERLIEADGPQFRYVIALRDPIARFISAFNWDKHDLVLNNDERKRSKPGTHHYYATFPTVNSLIDGLQSTDVSVRGAAEELAKYGHMGMGLSWYLPERLIRQLPVERSFVIRAEQISEDLDSVLVRAFGRNLNPRLEVPKLKSDYKDTYNDYEAIFPTYLSPRNKLFLADHLAPDVRCHYLLSVLLAQ